ncbi:MAG TPA: MBG domain-containing protein [Opitutus sp.]|nr:MBG domain-containing protein [Opitutus sp.]
MSNVAVPAITSATYNASTGALVVTGTGFLSSAGATNDIVANKFTLTGEGGATYTLTDTANVEITSRTSFTLTLSATDRAAMNAVFNKNGTASTGSTTYNVAAAEDWAAGADAAVAVADASGNGITMSNVSVPAITSAAYNASTGALIATGSGFLSASGATNDVVANKFTLTGEGGATYTLTDTANVEITSSTSFTLTLSATDRTGVSFLFNKNGTSSTGGTTYNVAAAEDWAAGADAAVVVADLTGNGVTVTNVAVPTITSATYNASTGALVVSGAGLSSAAGATNDIVANKFTLTGEGGATYTLTDTANAEITSATAFTLVLSATDRSAVTSILNKNGASSVDATTSNLAAAEDWVAGADAAVAIADLTGNGITVSNVDSTAPTISGVTSSTSDDSYKIGDAISIQVNFSENVVVTGTPQLTLETGTTDRTVNFASGSGGSSLTFTYTVQEGDTSADLDYTAVSALALNGGTIKDEGNNNAVLTLPAPGATDSLGANKALVIDGVRPTVTSVARQTPSTAAVNATSVVFRVTFSEAVTGVGTADFTTTVAGVTANLASVSAVSGSVYDVTLDTLSGIGTLRLDVGTGGITDAAGNTLTSAYSSGEVYNVDTSAQFPIAADFNGKDDTSLTNEGWLLAGDATAIGDRLRLTRAVNAVAGTAIYNQPFASAVGVNVQFDYEMSGGTGADGLAFFLVDGAQANPTSGAAGPSFGYAYGGNVVAGSSKAYLGVGFDLWGNFTSTISFHDGLIAGVTPNRIALRGPATQASSMQMHAEYDYVVGSAVSYTVAGIRKVNLTITPDGHITMLVSANGGETWTTIYEDFDFGGSAAFNGYTQPATLKLGFGASTGGSTNLHAIDNVVVRKPADHTVAFSSVPTGAQNAGAAVSYTVTVTNEGWNDDPAARLVYSLPAALTDVAWTYAVDGGTPVTGTTSSIDETFALAAGKSAVLVVDATIDPASAGTSIVHTATITPSSAFGDLAPVDNTASSSTTVNPTPAITSTLTATATYKTAFTYTVTATNTPTSFAATGLPTGLSLNTATGAISGSPTQTGSFNVSLTGTNVSGTGAASTLVLTVGKAPLTVTANNASREYGVPNPAFSVSYAGLLGGDTAASLTTAPTATTTATANSAPGSYTITPAGGVSANYTFSYTNGLLTVTPASQSISFATLSNVVLGETVSLSAAASSGLSVQFSVVSGPATISGSTLSTTGLGTVTVRASQSGNANYLAAPSADRSFAVVLGSATVTTPTQTPAPATGGKATLEVVDSNPNVTYTWQRNGSDLPGATGPSLTLNDVQPPTAGLYTYTASVSGGGSGTSEPLIVGITTDQKVVGDGEEILQDVKHPNGNTYDQVLVEGDAAVITANASQITRASFVDLSGDIVQVEFSGAGSLSIVIDGATVPAPALNYNQPGVAYVKGHAGIVITGANETSNVSVVSVGRINAVNQSLFVDTVNYDGIADIAYIAIQSANGKFGGIRTGNVNYFASAGFTGVYAPGVEFSRVYVGDITAFDDAEPLLVVGAATDARITGGSLLQDNGAPVKVSGLTQLKFTAGTTSHGVNLPAQSNQGRLEEEGVDVTALIVVNP